MDLSLKNMNINLISVFCIQAYPTKQWVLGFRWGGSISETSLNDMPVRNAIDVKTLFPTPQAQELLFDHLR